MDEWMNELMDEGIVGIRIGGIERLAGLWFLYTGLKQQGLNQAIPLNSWGSGMKFYSPYSRMVK
jgi:hypothetical protein